MLLLSFSHQNNKNMVRARNNCSLSWINHFSQCGVSKTNRICRICQRRASEISSNGLGHMDVIMIDDICVAPNTSNPNACIIHVRERQRVVTIGAARQPAIHRPSVNRRRCEPSLNYYAVAGSRGEKKRNARLSELFGCISLLGAKGATSRRMPGESARQRPRGPAEGRSLS